MNETCGYNEISTTANHLVQIRASSTEIGRRIDAFTRRKRAANDERNRRLYCGRAGGDVGDCDSDTGNNSDTSCARVDAVHMVRMPGCKGRIKVSRVSNKDGPQTAEGAASGSTTISATHSTPADLGYGIEERLGNLETHLGLSAPHERDSAVVGPISTLARIKQLEERLLFLEGVSPEYAQCINAASIAASASSQRLRSTAMAETYTGQRQPLEVKDSQRHPDAADFPGNGAQAVSLGAIDRRIRLLREKLHTQELHAPDGASCSSSGCSST